MSILNKKVLIITYYWPPSGGSGVQRWLKFVKYLPSFGWVPHVFTPENPSFSIKDESLVRDITREAVVVRFPIWEPYDLFFKFLKLSGSKTGVKPTDLVTTGKRSFFQSLTNWIRGNFFIPDPRVFWVRPSVRFLNAYIRDNDIHTIITTGPPHSLHLIGLKLKRKNPSLRWFADFRDPWSEWGLLDSLQVSGLARKRHRHLESKVLGSADEIITITPFYVKKFEQLSKRNVRLLTNGFDEDDFSEIRHIRPEKFLIRHIGIINEKCDPIPFLNAVSELIMESSHFADKVQIEFIGEVHQQVKAYVNGSSVLKRVIFFSGNIPHQQLMELYGSSALLLLILTGYKDAEGYMPGKLFEYIATGLPVLGVGPENGDAAGLLKESGAGVMVESVDGKGIKGQLYRYFTAWQAGDEAIRRSAPAENYSRRAITGRLSELLG